VEELLSGLATLLSERFGLAEMIVVDDGCPADERAAIADLLASVPIQSIHLKLARPHGLEPAMLAGLERAVGDFVIELDSPYTPDLDDLIPEMYETAAGGIDIVAAAERRRSYRSRIFYSLLNRTSHLGVEIGTERIRIVSRRALNKMLSMTERLRHRKILYALTGYPRRVVTYDSESVMRRPIRSETIEEAADLLFSASNIGLRVIRGASLGFGLFSLTAIGWTIANYFLKDQTPEGWATVMLVASVGFTGLFVVVGILGGYLSRLLKEVQGRPLFAIEESVTRTPAKYPPKTEPATPQKTEGNEAPAGTDA
jgi:glycosyltransferase involved in cell wall biosynthesis